MMKPELRLKPTQTTVKLEWRPYFIKIIFLGRYKYIYYEITKHIT